MNMNETGWVIGIMSGLLIFITIILILIVTRIG